ncbi:MAG: amidohydrolase family protein [Gemmatimonadaceae bacterium]|nr:amidohydrolase family protein [Gemmatimonadaceae bacterium]MCW5827284.1 amidohydrolase family protein [Gemmatimonadaceae bacterium]
MSRPVTFLRLAALLAFVTASLGAQARPADIVVLNGRIYTADAARPIVAAMAVRDGRVVFTGDAAGARALVGNATRVLDLQGKTVIPGMTDAHAHVLGLGQRLQSVDLFETRSFDEVVARVVERAKETPKGEWILGRGWDQNDWGNTSWPTHEALSRAVPDHPVMLTRVDGHAGIANAAAMRAASLTRSTRSPAGGEIIKDAQGNPTGVLIDNAQRLVSAVIPPATRAQVKEMLEDAIAEMHRWGLTGVHDAGASAQTLELYEELGREGKLNIRLYAMISDHAPTIEAWFRRGPLVGGYDGTLWVRSIKLYQDGALGSRGAALLEPYSDDPQNTGLLVSPAAHIREVADRALVAGFQVNSHAIGDRGNRLVLDAYEGALKARPTADHRFRVEHAQILHSDDIPRFAQLGVIPSMQASHQTSDMYWAGTRLGEGRLRGAYAWRSLIASNVIIPNGSDFPVEYVNPLLSFKASVSRQDANNWPAGGWYPEQRMTREEALLSMSLWAAYAGFQESELGSLTPGKRADFVVLDQDIMRIAAEDLLATQVLSTWVGGRSVYERK